MFRRLGIQTKIKSDNEGYYANQGFQQLSDSYKYNTQRVTRSLLKILILLKDKSLDLHQS